MFSVAGTAPEAGTGGRSMADGSPVHGSLMGSFSLYIASFTLLVVHCGSLVSTLRCPEQFPQRKTSRVVTKTSSREISKTRSKVSKQFTLQYHKYWIQ